MSSYPIPGRRTSSSTDDSSVEDYNPHPGRAQSESTLRRASSSTAHTNRRTVRPNSASPPAGKDPVDALPLAPHLNTFDGMVDETLTTVEGLSRRRAEFGIKHATKRTRSSTIAPSKVARIETDRRDPLCAIRNHSIERARVAKATKSKDPHPARSLGAPSRGREDAGATGAERLSGSTRGERMRVPPGKSVVSAEFSERQNPLPPWPSQATPPGLVMPPPRATFASPPQAQLTPPADNPPRRSHALPVTAIPLQPHAPPPQPSQLAVKKKTLGMRPYRTGASSPSLSQRPFKVPLPRVPPAKTASGTGGQAPQPELPNPPTACANAAKTAAPITPEDTPPRVKPYEGGGGEDEAMKDADSSMNYPFDEIDQEMLNACSIYDHL